MRELATIQKILALEPIDGADAIEKATVLGWQLVVKKGEFEVGSLVVYCEIDCVMPDKPDFEFLKPRGMRIRTVRLRGQISQGICFPTTILPPDFAYNIGTDCTDVLGITKYEPPIPACLGGKTKGNFPSFIPKTDETRVQNLQKLLDKYKDTPCYITEKLDGSSATYYIKDGVFGVCSRNLELTETDSNSFWKVAKQMNIEDKLRVLNRNVAFQGELIGEGIQHNRLKVKGQEVRFFNVYDIDACEYLPFKAFSDLMHILGLPTVPIIKDDYLLANDINTIVHRATRRSVINPDVWAEGIVIRPLEERRDYIGRVSFKAINPEFLLKYAD